MYQTLLAKYGPQGVAGFNWNESQSLFVQGKAAMWLDGIGFAQPLEDPTKSRIVGKVGYGVMPPGPKAAGVGDVRRRRRHLDVLARRRARPGSTCSGRRTRPTRRACCRPRRARRCATRHTPTREALGRRSRRRRHGSIACWARRRSRSPGLPVIVPVTEFRDIVRHRAHQHDQRRGSGDRAEEGDGGVPAGARQEREGLRSGMTWRRPAEAGPTRGMR